MGETERTTYTVGGTTNHGSSCSTGLGTVLASVDKGVDL